MAEEKWQKVREIFDATIRRKPEERLNFVIETCGDDKSLRAEVESLLSSLDSADSFLETPAVAKIADAIEVEMKKLERGKRFNHFICRRNRRAGLKSIRKLWALFSSKCSPENCRFKVKQNPTASLLFSNTSRLFVSKDMKPK